MVDYRVVTYSITTQKDQISPVGKEIQWKEMWDEKFPGFNFVTKIVFLYLQIGVLL